MNPLFIHDWAERDPEIRWPCVYMLLIALVVLGCTVAPNELEDPADLTDAQHAALVEHKRSECSRDVGPGYIFFERANGDAVCRDGGLK